MLEAFFITAINKTNKSNAKTIFDITQIVASIKKFFEPVMAFNILANIEPSTAVTITDKKIVAVKVAFNNFPTLLPLLIPF
ncbi:hypothetical protein SDC9_195246 [bioreactor metagenome]|uniref:Uncharacterized protein n=1 Tax=bioreactor metagenome TaxID=1076179 RepID=A0A645IJZ8_9ZZZZ